MYNHIFFDWDGCLCHTLPMWHQRIRKACNAHNITITDSDIIKHLLPTLSSSLKFGVTDLESFVTEVVSGAETCIDQTQLNKDVAQTLKTIRSKGKKQAVITSTDRAIITAGLNYHTIAEYFDLVLSRDDVTKTKPDPAPLHQAITHFQCDKESCVMMGDSDADIRAGQAAGVKTILFYPPENELYHDYEHLKALKPDYIIREFKEVAEVVA